MKGVFPVKLFMLRDYNSNLDIEKEINYIDGDYIILSENFRNEITKLKEFADKFSFNFIDSDRYYCIKTIWVKKTIKPGVVREIITGEKFPLIRMKNNKIVNWHKTPIGVSTLSPGLPLLDDKLYFWKILISGIFPYISDNWLHHLNNYLEQDKEKFREFLLLKIKKATYISDRMMSIQNYKDRVNKKHIKDKENARKNRLEERKKLKKSLKNKFYKLK